ncbi:MAG: VanZ family protein [Candidatus Cloacimonetes bacterium]|jgi:VanZ family protein|nr:VanZ family protein [Candidatus Cloacimonadota bacterium]MDD2506516.1 VanZ family protein [Candidatus Cloacimonadota bacterium]MDD4559846.1 VanZ family protein [Candidatus Cloacimonadota bacterium]
MKSRGYLTISILWMCIVWLVSSLPARELPQVQIIGMDKAAHFFVYGVWAILNRLYADSRFKDKIRFVITLLFLLAMAALDEYHQAFIPGRDVSFYDLVANWTGIFCGWFGTILFLRRRVE